MDIAQSLMTSMITLLGGVILFIFGEFAKVLIIIPLQKFKEQTQLTLDRIDFYANRLKKISPANLSEEDCKLIRQIEDDLRSSATQLSSKYSGLGCRNLLIRLRVIPSKEERRETHDSLMFLSNNILREGHLNSDENNPITLNNNAIKKIKNALAR